MNIVPYRDTRLKTTTTTFFKKDKLSLIFIEMLNVAANLLPFL